MMKKAQIKDEPRRITIREVPPDVHEKLVEMAAKNRRSLNQQLLFLLENYVKQQKTSNGS